MLYVEGANAQHERFTSLQNKLFNHVGTFQSISEKATTNELQFHMPSFEVQANLPEIVQKCVVINLNVS